MPGCPVEKAQEKVLNIIAENGSRSGGLLADAYSQHEPTRAAIKRLIFGEKHEFARKMLIEAVSRGGDLRDVEHVLLHLVGHEKAETRAGYVRQKFVRGKVLHEADRDEGVRNSALFAIEKILNGNNMALSMEGGRALVKCALADPSEQARVTAARIIGKHAGFATFSQLLIFMGDAEKSEEHGLFSRGEVAMEIMVENMNADRPRGSLLKPLISTSLESKRMWEVGQRTILRLFENTDMKVAMKKMVEGEREKLLVMKDAKGKLAMGRIDSLLKAMGGDHPQPSRKRKMTAEAELGESLMAPPRKMRGPIEYGPEAISRGAVVDKVLRVGRAIRRMVKGPRK